MKILRLCQSVGNKRMRVGMETHFLNLSKMQTKLGIDVTVLAGADTNTTENFDGLKLYKIKDNLPFAYLSLSNGFFKKFKEIDRKEHFDLIHGHNPVVYGFMLHEISRPFVYTIHGSILNYKRDSISNLNWLHSYLYYIFSKGLCQKADFVTVGSSETRNDVINHFKISPSKVKFIPAGVDLEKFRPNLKQNIKEKLKITGKMVLYVGRFAKIKNLQMLLRIVPKIVNEFPGTKFVLVGGLKEDNNYDAIRKFIREIKIENSVSIIPPLPHEVMPLYYNACDVFVHTSLAEAVPKVIVEAMSCGKPVVATNIIGTRDAMDNGKNGFLVELGNHNALAKRISLLLSDPSLRKKMGGCGRQKAEKEFGWKSVAKKYIKIYEMFV